jgi:uncharacterized protein (DUF924 family)
MVEPVMSDTSMPQTADSVLDFWFGSAPATASSLKASMKRWYAGGAALDTEIATRFGDMIAAAVASRLGDWAGSARGRLALILLLDQFPRSVYRGTARAFASDPAALSLTLGGIESGQDRTLDFLERLFFYMPMQHAESLEVQQRSVAVFAALAEEPAPAFVRDALAASADYARQHRDIIACFGRFPHRNGILGRTSTPEEIAYLEGGAPTFGQSTASIGTSTAGDDRNA